MDPSLGATTVLGKPNALGRVSTMLRDPNSDGEVFVELSPRIHE
jgi:hypothetical protein